MIRLAQPSIRRPKAALVAWAAFATVFVAIGLGITDSGVPLWKRQGWPVEQLEPARA